MSVSVCLLICPCIKVYLYFCKPVSVFLLPVPVFVGFLMCIYQCLSIILVAVVCVFTGVISVLRLLFCTWIYVFLYAFTFVLYYFTVTAFRLIPTCCMYLLAPIALMFSV